MLMLYIVVLAILELCMYSKIIWRFRLPLSLIFITANVTVVWILFSEVQNIYSIWFLLVTALRLFNLSRILKGRVKSDHLQHSGFRTSSWIIIFQLPSVVALWLGSPSPTSLTLAFIISMLSAVSAMVLFAITSRNLRSTHYTELDVYYTDRDLPSLTVAIPARNETLDLENCLHSVVASDYPKLEIIVLDDSLHGKTPDIIKRFAQNGVRFVQGSEPDEHWLAKNFAYQRLLEEASGELILFCGVDVRFEPESLRRIVTAMLARKKSMVSIMPRRFTDSISGSFIQPMRYWWELALPRRQFDRPPVLSTCWIITNHVLKKFGGFASVSHRIIPESYFARELIKTDGYSFLRSDAFIGLETQKSPEEQLSTATRVLYPELHKRPELAFLMVTIEILLLLSPFYLVLYGITSSVYIITYVASIAVVFLIATHVRIIAASSPPSIPIALVSYPLAVLIEIYLGLLSMYKYEFSDVIWKGRSLTSAPTMQQQVIPHLPKID